MNYCIGLSYRISGARTAGCTRWLHVRQMGHPVVAPHIHCKCPLRHRRTPRQQGPGCAGLRVRRPFQGCPCQQGIVPSFAYGLHSLRLAEPYGTGGAPMNIKLPFPRRSVASRGKAIYQKKILPLVYPQEKGKIVVIDIQQWRLRDRRRRCTSAREASGPPSSRTHMDRAHRLPRS